MQNVDISDIFSDRYGLIDAIVGAVIKEDKFEIHWNSSKYKAVQFGSGLFGTDLSLQIYVYDSGMDREHVDTIEIPEETERIIVGWINYGFAHPKNSQ